MTDRHAPGARWAQLREQTLATAEGRRNWELGRRAAATHRDVMRVLDEVRRVLGISQTELARRLDKSQPTVARLLTKGENPTLGTLDEVLRAIGVRARLVVEADDSVRAENAEWQSALTVEVRGSRLQRRPYPSLAEEENPSAIDLWAPMLCRPFRRRQRLPLDMGEVLREVANRPGVISLAGGLPTDDLLPVDECRRALEWIYETRGRLALNYSSPEGHRALRDALAERMRHREIDCVADDLLITNGAQQGLDLIGKVLLEPGDLVALENPTYGGAVDAFDQYGADYLPVPSDEDGMRVDVLGELLAKNESTPRPRPIKFIYTNPNFQNPTGRTMSLERRQKLLELASRYRVAIVEDDSYGELRFEGEQLPSLKSLDTVGSVAHVGSFSGIFAPGLRIGWVAAGSVLRDALVDAKQASDLHTAGATQVCALFALTEGIVEHHLAHVRNVLRERRDVLANALERFGSGFRFSRPHGGSYLWAELPESIDARQLLPAAVQQGVAFMPGEAFHVDNSGLNTVRLNFSAASTSELEEAARRLASSVQQVTGTAASVEIPVGV